MSLKLNSFFIFRLYLKKSAICDFSAASLKTLINEFNSDVILGLNVSTFKSILYGYKEEC